MGSQTMIRIGRRGLLPVLQAVGVVAFAALTTLPAVAVWPDAAALLLVALSQALVLVELRPRLMTAEGPQRRLWRLLVVALAMLSLSMIFEAGSIVLQAAMPPTPSLGDLLRLAGFLAAAASLSTVPVSDDPRFGRLRDLLEVVLIVLGAFVLFWLTIVRPALDVGIGDLVMILWAALAPAFDWVLALLGLRLALLSETARGRRMYAYLGLAFALRLTTDLAFGYASLSPARMPGSILHLGWMLTPLALLVSARQAAHGPIAKVEQASGPKSRRRKLAGRLAAILPAFLTYLIAGSTLADWWLTRQVSWLGVAATAGLGLLLVARQGVIAGQAETRQYASLVQGAADLAFVADEHGKLLLTNPALRHAVGLSARIEPGESLSNFLPQAEAGELIERAIPDGWSGETELIRPDGTRLPVALSLRPVYDERRDAPLLAATAHDLTDLKAREDELRAALDEVAAARLALENLNRSLEAKVRHRTQELAETVADLQRVNEELKELDRLKSEFVTLVSHELRGPLTNIRSGVELALKRGVDLAVTVDDTLALVASETERLVSFVEIILDLSALEAGRFPLTLEPVPIPVLARAVANRFPADAGARRIHLELEADLPDTLGDERAITSVLFHLIDNALKYAPASPVRVIARRQADTLRVAVVDDGPGIPPDEREAVFDRFHRLDSSDAREVYGHGLGLYLSRRLLEAMGGGIEAIEAESGGAEVAFWLPLAVVRSPLP